MTRIYKGEVRYGEYRTTLPRQQVPAYQLRRLREWWIDQLAEFWGWREQSAVWRRLSAPYWKVSGWIGARRRVPDTIEEMNRRGVVDARKLGL